jgi:hypothetical protein
MVNACCVTKLFSPRRSWTWLAMEVMMNEDSARMLREESNKINSNEEKNIIMMWKQNGVIELRK